MTKEEIRQLCLTLANSHDSSPKEIVDKAKAFEEYMIGIAQVTIEINSPFINKENELEAFSNRLFSQYDLDIQEHVLTTLLQKIICKSAKDQNVFAINIFSKVASHLMSKIITYNMQKENEAQAERNN